MTYIEQMNADGKRDESKPSTILNKWHAMADAYTGDDDKYKWTPRSRFTDFFKDFAWSRKMPPATFRKLLMMEFQNLIKRPHLYFISSDLNLKIGNKYYNKLENSLNKIFSKKNFIDLDKQDKFLVDMGHFNFHGENILISDFKTLDKFKLIDPDTRWKILDPMFSMARYFYTYSHDTAEKKNYYIKSNIFDLNSNNQNFYFNTKVLWSNRVDKVYKKMFDINLMKKKMNRFEKLRFNLSYLLCLLRGINANYEEKITFFKNKNNLLQNNGIFFSLLAIKYAHQITYEE